MFGIFKKKKVVEEVKLPQQPLNFINDIEFLHHIISVEVERTFRAHDYSIDNKYPVLKERLAEMSEDTSVRVIASLSDSYITALYRYFNENGLSLYIIGRITDILLEYAHSHNQKILYNSRADELLTSQDVDE